MKKLLLTSLLAIMMAIAAYAEPKQIGTSTTYWEIIGTTLYITGTGDMPNFASQGYQPWYSNRNTFTQIDIAVGITAIGNYAFYDCTNLTSVTIPNSVATIGNSVFNGCTKLTSVNIPNSVTAIGVSAFYGCSSLSSVAISNNVKTIGNYAFYNCLNLTSIVIPNSVTNIGYNAFQNCSKITSVTIGTSVETIGNSAFSGCTSLQTVNFNAINCTTMGEFTSSVFTGCTALTTLNIGSGVKNIPYNAFRDCKNLSSVIIPNSVITIEGSAFYGCSSLSSVTIPNSVTTIGSGAFYGCTKLTSVTIGTSVETIGNSAFSGCTSLETVNFNAINCITMGQHSTLTVFNGCTALATLNIGSGVKNIPTSAFYGCSSLNSVTIPESVTSIGTYAFSNCSSLNSITIPNSVTSIGSYTFSDCTNLSSITIPNSITNIESYTFSGCTNLSSVTIPESVTSIGNYAFYGCTSINPLTIPNSVTNIGSYAFSGCASLNSITIPESVITIGGYAFQNCTSLEAVNFNAINCTTMAGSYSVFSGCTAFTTLNIGSGVKNILAYAFRNCSSLSSITIPEGVISIGNYAFSGCSGLSYATIPESVTSIGNYAFQDCTSLETVNFNAINCTTMGNFSYPVFSGCTAFTTLNIGSGVKNIPAYAFSNCVSLSSVTIPEGVISIGTYAFSGCSSLSYATIPESVTTIGSYAFQDGISLETVNFNAINCTTMGSSSSLVFDGCTAFTTLNIGSGVKNIPANAFRNCISLNSVTIPESVTTIGSYAFNGCTSLETVNFNAINCTTMGSSSSTAVFNGCTALTTLNIGSGVTNIPNFAFRNCTGLIELTIPENVTAIGNLAFSGCTGLQTVNFNAINCTTMGNSSNLVFDGCTALTTLNTGNSVKIIPENAFRNCSSINSVIIPNIVTTIGNAAFDGCSKITLLTIGTGVETIGSWAFRNCSSISSVTIPENIETIGSSAFSGCTSLETVNFNAINCTIEGSSYSSVFNGCTALTTLNIGNEVKIIPACAFNGCNSIKSLTIPESVEKIGEEAFKGCTSLETVNFNAINCTTMDRSSSYPIFEGCTAFNILNIGNGVKNIPDYLFLNCVGLTELTIPENVTSIGYGAFGSCSSLQTVNFNAINCTTMGAPSYRASVFDNCSALTTLNIGSGVTYIPDNAFYSFYTIEIETINFNAINCTSMTNNSVWWNALTTLNIGNEVTTIPANSFSSSKLTTLTIPASVTSIGSFAFSGCSGLTQIINYAQTPQNISPNVFTDVNKTTCTLYVLSDSQAAYETAMVWRDFTNRTTFNPVTGVSLSQTALTLAIGEAETLKANIEPVNATENRIASWTSSNTDVVVVNEQGMVFALAAGTAIITATTQEGGFTATCTITVEGNICGSGTPIACGLSGSAIWTLCADGTLTVNGYEMIDYSSNNPSPFIAYQDVITTVVIGESVTAVGNRAFQNCTALTTVYFNAVNCTYSGNYIVDTSLGMTNITNNRAFIGCDNISAVHFGDKVKMIPSAIFRDCSKLTSLTLPESVESILIYAFYGASFDSITIPESLTSIGSYAFSNNSKLATLNYNAIDCTPLNDTRGLISDVHWAAFGDCDNLSAITFGDNVKTIPYTFGTNTKVASLTIPESVEAIGGGAFSNFTGLITVNFNAIDCTTDDEKYPYEDPAFQNCSNLNHVTFGDKVKIIPSVFRDCIGLYSVHISDNVTTIGNRAFNNCRNLTRVTIGENVTAIGPYAFSGCSWLTEITLPQSLNTIGGWAFANCNKLESVAIPANVTNIEGNAFSNCSALKSVKVNWENPISITRNVFSDVTISAVKLIVPVRTSAAYRAAAVWQDFDIEEEEITVKPETTEVYFSWQAVETATMYILTIYSDEACMDTIYTFEFDAEGNFLEMKNFSPITRVAGEEQFAYSVGNLLENTTYYFRLTAIDNNDIVIRDEQGDFKTLTPTDIHIVDATTNVSIYPNPVLESFRIRGIAENTQLIIVDISGKIVMQIIVNPDETIWVDSLEKGIYIVNAGGKTIKMNKQ